MTAAIKRMLAEREAVEAARSKVRAPHSALDLVMEQIDMAAAFIDEGSPANNWKPSEKLKVAFLMMACSRNSATAAQAASFVWRMLEVARERYRAGVHPNQFLEPNAALGGGQA